MTSIVIFYKSFILIDKNGYDAGNVLSKYENNCHDKFENFDFSKVNVALPAGLE